MPAKDDPFSADIAVVELLAGQPPVDDRFVVLDVVAPFKAIVLPSVLDLRPS